ncbi:hypothetical protein PGTUg99_014919 [Puccinia graminis f. sp. tritici]|uniref:Uncharacterized protein n=1 Tax=Puccinia graminis f. sp. tritici TaxID=56615 RepID=A0A5B0MRA2_PUCGR|nr:hypothetical protein PGTUg99_014919 [Puccinia graminis f. sp. tritici]
MAAARDAVNQPGGGGNPQPERLINSGQILEADTDRAGNQGAAGSRLTACRQLILACPLSAPGSWQVEHGSSKRFEVPGQALPCRPGCQKHHETGRTSAGKLTPLILVFKQARRIISAADVKVMLIESARPLAALLPNNYK